MRNAMFQIAWCAYFLFHYFFMHHRCIFVKARILFRKGRLVHDNWGDDLNFYFLSLISGKKVIFCPNGKIGNLIKLPHILGIGSILSFWSLDKATVIGSGVISDSDIDKIYGKPEQVCFVRGPISRKILAERGIKVPELYGDLVLALPLYYRPNILKRNKLGIVLHYIDENLDSVGRIKENFPSIKFIYMHGYKKWTDVIDEILSCEVILSSSLHGLVCSEAYKICCQWICFSDKLEYSDGWQAGWKLKFYDFFASLGKTEEPVEVSQETDLIELGNEVRNKYIQNDFDARKLIDALPSTMDEVLNGRSENFHNINKNRFGI